MKHRLLKYLAILCLAIIPQTSFGQGRIYTRKAKLEDFPNLTLKVVLTGNRDFDDLLKKNMSSAWTVSPFEFCNASVHKKLKNDPSYSFLYTTTEDGVTMLNLDRGGKKNDSNLYDRGFRIVSIPYCGGGPGDGREAFLPLLISSIQDFVLQAMFSDGKAYSGLSYNNLGFLKNLHAKQKRIYISENDLGSPVGRCDPIVICSLNEADRIVTEKREGAIVGFAVYPENPTGKSYFHIMLIDVSDGRIIYYDKRRYDMNYDIGFSPKDIDIWKSLLTNT